MENNKRLLKKDKAWFRIAEHLLEVSIPDTDKLDQLLPSFVPFKCNRSENEKTMCVVQVVETAIDVDLTSSRVLSDNSGVLGCYYRLMETDSNYITDIRFAESATWYRMVSDKCFTVSQAYIDRSDACAGRVLTFFIMIAFAQSAVLHQTLLIHASVVGKAEQGYAFLGKSGTGKSTHSALWIRYLDGVELLNDDNPAIRIEEDSCIWIYGTPWSGKTPCYKNRKIRLRALVRLEQSTVNRFIQKKDKDAMIALLPGCSSMRWSKQLYAALCDLLELIIRQVPVCCLECLPDQEAALLCYSEIAKTKKV